MRLSILLLSCLSSSILARPVKSVSQDTVAVLASGRNLAASFNNLADAIRDMEKFKTSNLLGEKTEWVLHHSKDLTSQLNHGIADVGRGPAVSANEVASLWVWNGSGAYDQLITAVRSTVTAWLSAKNTIVSTGGKKAVLDFLQDHKKLSKQFSDAVSSKMPSSGQLYASTFAYQVGTELDRAINTFR